MANGRAGCVFNSGKQNLCLAAGHYGTHTYTYILTLTLTPTHTLTQRHLTEANTRHEQRKAKMLILFCAHIVTR